MTNIGTDLGIIIFVIGGVIFFLAGVFIRTAFSKFDKQTLIIGLICTATILFIYLFWVVTQSLTIFWILEKTLG